MNVNFFKRFLAYLIDIILVGTIMGIISAIFTTKNARKVLRSPLTTIFLIINSLAVKSSLSSLTIFILNIFLPNV